MKPMINEATTFELLDELASRSKSELTTLEENVDRARQVYENAKDALAARKKFFKGLGFTKTEAESSFPCEEEGCDRTFDSAQGARMHHTRAHKNNKEQSGSDVLGPAPDPNGILECDCGDRFDSASILLAHTTKSHGRRPTTAERTPR